MEYAGEAIRGLEMEGRLTVCNLSIELGAKIGMVAPDEKTYDYLKGRRHAPKGALWDQALAHWKTLPSDADAKIRQGARASTARRSRRRSPGARAPRT